jgi:quercetin dioxygenase-like cupin family protein
VAAGKEQNFMSSTTSNVSPRQDTYWWQGSVMEIQTRAEDSGGALGVLEGHFLENGYGPPLHVHRREDEAMYVLEGQIRFRVGDDEFVAGPDTWVWQPRGIPHTFKVESEGARALVIFMPGGLERMFEEGGVPAGELAEAPDQEYDLEAAAALAKRYGFEIVGPQLA